MNSLEREIKVEKLNKNLKRQNYLKILSLTCLGLDFFTFIIFESIELGFTNLENNTDFLIFYIVKLCVFIVLCLFIIFTLVHGKNRLLLFGSITYLTLGLGLFSYLIAGQMINSNDSKPIEDIKPAIYYSLFLNIIICLNILSGVFRLLGAIFMFIYVRISYKIKKGTKELNEYLIPEQYKFSVSVNDSLTNSSTISKLRTNTQSLIEPPRTRAFAFTNNYSASFADNQNGKENMYKDLNIYINNTEHGNSNNIYVHFHNYQNPDQIEAERKICNFTYESEKEKDDHLDSFYETPKKDQSANSIANKKSPSSEQIKL